ncbi:ABC transporter ATP-binding protein [Paramicrobacterium agarici]|uniref:ABC-2 type transport system ATP-binding protein n=1 Tax=Paramicrobacterium agarici TaxID=630514 RepID=A0A2A9DU61_9MICO|nr:ABC transporter ATP-binding protein [Microbacterium agarici]PFG30124.1 ABC-2 type transport system ATP-binding protein [Microbacterium agarici]
MTAITTRDLAKVYKDVRAVDDVSIDLEPNRIYGLLGRNGAGKTTLMQLLTGQVFATSGNMRVFGESPVENAQILAQTCFIQESQKYPDTFRAKDVIAVAASVYPNWDAVFAEKLIADFRLPVKRLVKKLSRGQLSAVGIIIGLASRAPLTFFDEPYLGLDAVARQIFYDRLLEDFASYPRTVVLSTHHIDEAANLLEHVVVLDEGKLLLDADTEELRGRALQVAGKADAVDAFLAGRDVLSRDELGALSSATIMASEGDAERADGAGLTVSSVSLQNLIVHLTTDAQRSAVAV